MSERWPDLSVRFPVLLGILEGGVGKDPSPEAGPRKELTWAYVHFSSSDCQPEAGSIWSARLKFTADDPSFMPSILVREVAPHTHERPEVKYPEVGTPAMPTPNRARTVSFRGWTLRPKSGGWVLLHHLSCLFLPL